jgi:soluble lytic murein transglycosylase-like protein
MSERLDLSSRARRRKGRARVALSAWGVSSLASLLGIPTGAQLLAQAVARPADKPAGAASTSTVVLERGAKRARGAARASTQRLVRDAGPGAPAPSEAPAPAAPETVEQPSEQPPADPEPAPEPQSVSGIIYAAAAEFGLAPDYLLSVASCESGLDPGAVNPAGYYGLFQFDEPTWGAYGYGSIWDPEAQARTAARMLAAGMSERWPNCA